MTVDSKVCESVAVKAEHWVVAKVDLLIEHLAASKAGHSDDAMADELDDD